MLRSLFAITALVLLTSMASGQNPYVLDVYGDGVHAFYRGNVSRAYEQFDKAIHYGSRDPRVYYFRALKSLREGNTAMAEGDIRTGATYEMRGQGTFDIGMALARFQGHSRIQFEEMRLNAKLDLTRAAADASNSVKRFDPSPLGDRPLGDDLPEAGTDPFTDDEGHGDPSDLNLDDTMDLDPDDAPEEDALLDSEPAEPLDDDPVESEPAPLEETDPDEDPFGSDEGLEFDPFG